MYKNSELFDDNHLLFTSMLNDIEAAQHYIYLETYRFNNDSIGMKFRDTLAMKCKQGVEVKLIVDSWGTSASLSFFNTLIQSGGEVKYFKKFKFFIDFFTKNHRRNHRKLLLIDDKITYIGSSNLSAYSLVWRESVLKIEGYITHYFKKTFIESLSIYNKYNFHKFTFKKTIKLGDFTIVQDIPSIYRQHIKNKFTKLINNARREILIETPYFIPGFMLRKALMDAADRGVDVKIIIPKHSDVRLVDLLRNKYLGMLYKKNVQMLFYSTGNLHAKCMLIDNEIFSIGSPNFDYRSFRYQYEIALIGSNDKIVSDLHNHMQKTMMNCEPFDYDKWLKRPKIERFFEWIMLPLRHLL